ncbi:MAG: sigma-70 family RNA polymerase sigma factor [Planctomycetota bacterium]
MSQPSTDVELMRAVAEGRAEALRTLFDRHAPLMLGIANKRLGDRHESEALVNEVFLELWQKADRFAAERGSVRTYLLLLTRSRATDRLRSTHRKSAGGDHTVQSIEHQPIPSADVSPPASAEQSELEAIVRSELAGLGVEQREMLELAFFRGLSHTQIADHTRQPLGTIKGRLRRGLLLLRERLNARLDGEKSRTPGQQPVNDSPDQPTDTTDKSQEVRE